MLMLAVSYRETAAVIGIDRTMRTLICFERRIEQVQQARLKFQRIRACSPPARYEDQPYWRTGCRCVGG